MKSRCFHYSVLPGLPTGDFAASTGDDVVDDDDDEDDADDDVAEHPAPKLEAAAACRVDVCPFVRSDKSIGASGELPTQEVAVEGHDWINFAAADGRHLSEIV